jgi:hypothetical protein
MVLEHHSYPLRWTFFVARHLEPVSLETSEILMRLAQHSATPTWALEAMVGRNAELTELDVTVVIVATTPAPRASRLTRSAREPTR